MLLRAGRQSAILVVRNPWQGASGVDMSVFLAGGGERPDAGFGGVVADVPLRRVVCMSSSHVAFLSALNQTDIIKGVSGGRYICDPQIVEGLKAGRVKDVGYDNSINFELLAALRPDLVLVYGVAGQSSVATGKTAEMGIRTAYIGDYLETTPLGKAEWIVAFGAMTGHLTDAITKFEKICRRYDAARALAAGVKRHPRVMLNAPWRDVWFVPGDSSYMVALIRDAGGAYACAGGESRLARDGDAPRESRGSGSTAGVTGGASKAGSGRDVSDASGARESRPLGAESAYIRARSADVWLNPGSVTTMAELTAENSKFASIPPVTSGRVWNNNLRLTAGGGSDFWESGAVAPDRILLDLVRILHPELLPGYQPYYYRQLK